MKLKKLSFPKDELSHPTIIEWWYFNGNLKAERGNDYAFMYCLFKVDPQRVKLPFFEKITVGNFYFSHHLLSDLQKKKFYSTIRFFYEGSETTSLLREKPFTFKIQTENFTLGCSARKPPLLINEIGWIDLKTKNTYYYSFPNMKVEGNILMNSQKISVTGKGWMDHQWADSPYSPEDKWIWFSLQLNNDMEILCFEYGSKKKTRLASISYPDGSQASTGEVNFKPLGREWTSPKTQAKYELGWKITVPEQRVELEIAPKLKEQEVIFGSINYWEGPVAVTGKIGEIKVTGEGFLEIVGVPMGKSIARIYLEDARNLVSDYISNYIARP